MNFKRLSILTMLLLSFSFSSFAKCTWDGNVINNSYRNDLTVDIHDMGDNSGYVQLFDFASHLQCQVGDHIEQMNINLSPDVRYYLQDFSGGDFRFLGELYGSTVSANLSTLSSGEYVSYDLTGKPGTFVPVNGALFLKIPSSVGIDSGTYVGLFWVKIGGVSVNVNLTLGSAYIKPKDYCEVNSGNTINVDFGSVDVMSVPSFINDNGSIKNTIAINCDNNISKSLSLYLEGESSSFSSSELIATSNKDLGVYLKVGGQVVAANDKVSVEVKNGIASKEISVGLVRNPHAKIDEISLGDFNSSSTIVLSED